MRFIIAILFLKIVVASGQHHTLNKCLSEIDTLTNQLVYRSADKMASFPGGSQALMKEVTKRIRLTHTANFNNGFKVTVAFIVQQDGKVTGERIIRNVSGTNLAEQYLDIINDFRWEPGICNDKTVSTIQMLPLILDLERDGR